MVKKVGGLKIGNQTRPDYTLDDLLEESIELFPVFVNKCSLTKTKSVNKKHDVVPRNPRQKLKIQNWRETSVTLGKCQQQTPDQLAIDDQNQISFKIEITECESIGSRNELTHIGPLKQKWLLVKLSRWRQSRRRRRRTMDTFATAFTGRENRTTNKMRQYMNATTSRSITSMQWPVCQAMTYRSLHS